MPMQFGTCHLLYAA